MRLLLALSLSTTLGQAVSAADPDLPAYLLEMLRVNSDEMHQWRRQDCMRGEAGQVFDEMVANGWDRAELPHTGAYCLAILQDAERRGQLLTPYKKAGNAGAALTAILTAAGQGAHRYTDPSGVSQVLTCAEAFDAGYVFAWAKTDVTLADLGGQDLEILTESCFAGKASTAVGALAGAHSAGLQN